VVEANTILAAAECNMPRALGEFGKGKHSAIADRLIRLVAEANKPVGFNELFREVSKDLDKPADLAVIIQSLEQSEKIHHVKTLAGSGWLPIAQHVRAEKYVDWSILTEEERSRL
jgi:hypothetical protein